MKIHKLSTVHIKVGKRAFGYATDNCELCIPLLTFQKSFWLIFEKTLVKHCTYLSWPDFVKTKYLLVLKSEIHIMTLTFVVNKKSHFCTLSIYECFDELMKNK